MTINEKKITTFQTICTVILRELRVARGVHQAVLADHCGKPPSFWEKIESGKTKFDLETLLRVCRPLDVFPSEVIQTAERYTLALRARGWSVVFADVGNADVLMEQAPRYWASPGYRFWEACAWVGPTILNTPWWMDTVEIPGFYGLTAVFEFADNEGFRKTQLDEERHRPVVDPVQPGSS